MALLDIFAPADQTEGTRSQVLRWLKAVGDTVTQHEPLIELETDKVTVEVPAPASGVLREIVKAEQDEIAPGEVLGRLDTSATAANAAEPGNLAARAAKGSESAARETGTHAAGTHAAIVHAPAAPDSIAGEGPRNDASAASDGSPPPSRVAAGGALARGAAGPFIGDTQRLSPAVKRLLHERGLDPSMIRGTGEGGRITVDDIATYDAAKQADDKVPTVGAEPRPRLVPHTAIRKRIAEHMVESLLRTAPHVTTVFEADLTAVMAHRSAHRAEFQQRGAPLTFTAYFLAATVDAIKAVPEANSRWTDTALEIYDDIHIGVATALEGLGLIVPVIRNVQSLDLFGIAQRLHELVTAARENRLDPGEVRGGTFTISNHGVSGSLLATPIIINQPQSAILGIGKVEKRAVVVDAAGEDTIAVRAKCYVTLTIDHRVMDGHQANRFLQTFVRTLESWPLDA